MPPRPFPFPLAVGTDICSIQRISSLLQRPKPRPASPPAAASILPQLHAFLARVFSYREILLFNERFHGLLQAPAADRDPALVASVTRHLAGRFAAKEAVVKAVRPRRIFLRDVVVASQADQPYAIVLDESPVWTGVQRLHLNQRFGFDFPVPAGTAAPADWDGHPDADAGVDQCRGQVAMLSISHDGEYATATCLAAVQNCPRPLLDLVNHSQKARASMGAHSSSMSDPAPKSLGSHSASSSQGNKRQKRGRRSVFVRLRKRAQWRIAIIRRHSDNLDSLLCSICAKASPATSEDGGATDQSDGGPETSAL